MCYNGDICAMKQAHIAKLEKRNNVLKEELAKAKEIINEFMRISKASDEDFEHDYTELIAEAKQFLKEVSE